MAGAALKAPAGSLGLSLGRSKSLMAAGARDKIRNCQSGGHPPSFARWAEILTGAFPEDRLAGI